jgi:chromosome segregation ATPase
MKEDKPMFGAKKQELTAVEPRVNRTSQAAAQAAQYVEDLENDLAHYKDLFNQAKNEIHLMKSKVAQVEEDNTKLFRSREFYMERNARIHGQLAIATKIILDIYDAEQKAEPSEQKDSIIHQAMQKAFARHAEEEINRTNPVAPDAADRT